tara:strand:- start:433 stop:876 length:444 start_codon:yes stop_codon:yes gene_type:complete
MDDVSAGSIDIAFSWIPFPGFCHRRSDHISTAPALSKVILNHHYTEFYSCRLDAAAPVYRFTRDGDPGGMPRSTGLLEKPVNPYKNPPLREGRRGRTALVHPPPAAARVPGVGSRSGPNVDENGPGKALMKMQVSRAAHLWRAAYIT